jgi:RsbRD-like negative regulator of sigma factor
MQTKEAIAEQWFARVLRTYPTQTAHFLAEEKDPFRNPVGTTFRQALAILLEELLLAMDHNKVAAALDSIMQIRAVQDSTPGRALEFLFQLKGILRDQQPGPVLELLDARIDEMALAAFDLYMKYRERLAEARVNETRRRVYVLERALQPGESTPWHVRGEK